MAYRYCQMLENLSNLVSGCLNTFRQQLIKKKQLFFGGINKIPNCEAAIWYSLQRLKIISHLCLQPAFERFTINWSSVQYFHRFFHVHFISIYTWITQPGKSVSFNWKKKKKITDVFELTSTRTTTCEWSLNSTLRSLPGTRWWSLVSLDSCRF